MTVSIEEVTHDFQWLEQVTWRFGRLNAIYECSKGSNNIFKGTRDHLRDASSWSSEEEMVLFKNGSYNICLQ